MDFKIFLFLSILVFSGCHLYMDEEPETLYFKNTSEHTVHIITKLHYADTVMPYIFSENTFRCTLKPNETKNSLIELDQIWENDSIALFIIDKKTCLNYSWSDITDKQMFLYIYVLSKEDILILKELHNYPLVVEFPPTSEMNKMRIIKF